MVCLRFITALLLLGLAASNCAQSVQLPDAPQPSASLLAARVSVSDSGEYSSSADLIGASGLTFSAQQAQTGQPAQNTNHGNKHHKPASEVPVDADGKPIPLERRQPQRILGFMPNFRSVSSGATPHPPGWKYNLTIATHQATDYFSA